MRTPSPEATNKFPEGPNASPLGAYTCRLMEAIGSPVYGGANSRISSAPELATKRFPLPSNARPSGYDKKYDVVESGTVYGGAYAVTVFAIQFPTNSGFAGW